MKLYYEGWYMKQQQGEACWLAVIPGRAQDSAFIQVVSNRGSLLAVPLETFDRTDGSMRIGDSLFTPYGMQLRRRTGFRVGRKRSLRSSAAAALGHHGAVRLRVWKRSIPCSACGTR